MKVPRDKEKDFALYLIDEICNDPAHDDVCIETLEQIQGWDRAKLISHLMRLNAMISQIYEVAHSWDRSHSCFEHHKDWRDKSIAYYKKGVKSGYIGDRFNLLEEENG